MLYWNTYGILAFIVRRYPEVETWSAAKFKDAVVPVRQGRRGPKIIEQATVEEM